MDDYGLITIDNRNLLDDLLGLSEQDDNPSQLNNQAYDYSRSRLPNTTTNINTTNSNNNNLLYQDSRKVYLESPTFTKREDDIYRYVQSRLSTVDPVTNRNNLINDSLNEFNENQNFSFNNEKVTNKLRVKNAQLLPQPLFGRNPTNSNRLMSDLAVASLPKNNLNIQNKNPRDSLEDPLYDNELLDSLENTNNKNFYQANDNYPNQYNSNINQTVLNYQDQQYNQQQQFQQQQLQQQQYQQQQQQLQQQQQQQQQYQQQIQLLPFQNPPKPGSVFTILPSPSTAANSLPIVQSSLQFQPTAPGPQFFPIALQPTPYLAAQPPPPQNMFMQEPMQSMQPMFYNPAYPINLNGPIPNANNYFTNKHPDYEQYQYPQAEFYNTNQYVNNQQANYQLASNLNGNKYDAQPLQPPPQMDTTPRQVSNNTNLMNNNNKKKVQPENVKTKSDDYDSPDSEDNADLNNEFNSMKVYDKNRQINSNNSSNANNNNNNNNDMSDEEMKKAEVWNKLKNAQNKRLDSKGNISQSKGSGLPPVNSTKSVLKQKPPLEKRESNFIEKNVESIKNKENLTHRYPEKKYESFYGKNITNRVKYFQGGDKVKPPHQLQPIENYTNEDYKAVSVDITNQDDLYSTKKISIPINPDALRNKDHINLDINLRLLDFLPNANSRNRSFDDFEVNDPLNQHIKRFESLSRSLPGSSGSLNKLKPLPPVNRRLTTHPSTDSKDDEMRYEDGYLAQLQKAQNRPVIKTYTLKDYRNFKKDAIPNTSTNTGKLGPDFENDNYRQKIEVAQKKTDYAERVKARNKILLAENKKNDDESINTVSQQSKTQRAKDYVRTHVLRPRSGSRSNSNELENDANSQIKYISSDRSFRGEQNLKSNRSVRLDLNSKSDKQRSLDKAIVRIRDPVTSKIRTLYLNDDQLDQLNQRHEEDKNKVNNLLNGGNTNRSNSNNSNSKSDVNNNINNGNSQSAYNLGSSSLSSLHASNTNQGIILKNNKKPVDLERSKIMEEYDKQLQEEDEEFQKLMERHNAEKNKVNEFEASPYLHENLPAENQIQ